MSFLIETSEDLDYVIESHKRIYLNEFNYDKDFVNFIVDAISEFSENRCPGMDNVWLLKLDGKPKGSIVIMRYEDQVAQLRWFLIEPECRGYGYGKPLLRHAVDFCKANGYQKIFLWTNSSLLAARSMYKSLGFEITRQKIRTLTNQELTEEKWELNLR
jgi:ribosomal protein S18 acetylase RimI-like enzyme